MIDGDYFSKKRQELGMERYDTLQKVQAWLDAQYPGQARAVSLNRGVLRVLTPSAAVSSTLRLQQTELLRHLADPEISRLQISISSR